jgi:hypothetical protein
MLPIDIVQRRMNTEPRVTVVTQFRDGSCALGPWAFVIDWRGRRPVIVLERPSMPARVSAR